MLGRSLDILCCLAIVIIVVAIIGIQRSRSRRG
jgi:hypothetical protein